MHDLLLHRLLVDRAYDDPRLPPLLDELGKLSPRERFPFLGGVLEIVESGPAGLREAALAALTSADGYVAIRAIVGALTTSEAAIDALLAASQTNASRWAHALFHPDSEVRRAAVSRPAPTGAKHLELHLLADEATRDAVLARPLATRPGDVVPVLELAKRGVLPRRAAQIALLDADVSAWLAQSRARPEEICEAYLRSALRPEGPDESLLLSAATDDLDDLFALFVDRPDDFAVLLKRSGKELFDKARVRAAASLLLLHRRTERPAPIVLEAAFRADVDLVRATFLPRATRKAALRALYGETEGPWRGDEHVLSLLWDPIATHEDGGPDLAVVGAILTRLTFQYFDHAFDWIGGRNIAAALGARPEDSAAFFFVPGTMDDSKLRYLELCPSTRARRRVLATIARDAPLASLSLLAKCDPQDVAHVLGELVPLPIDRARAEALATPLALRIGPSGVAEALSSWRGRPRGEAEGDLARSLLMASAREHETSAWVAAFARAACIPFVLDRIDHDPTFPYGKEVALAHALAASKNPAERAWAEPRVRREAPVATERRAAPTPREIATARLEDLPSLLAGVSDGGVPGVAALLAKRTGARPSVAAVVALLSSPDPVEATAPVVAAHFSEEPAFLASLDVEMARRFSGGHPELSLLGHAWLWRWEWHAERTVSILCRLHGSLGDGLAAIRGLPWERGRADLFAAAMRWLAVTNARDEGTFRALVSSRLVDVAVAALPEREGPHAADVLTLIARHAETADFALRRIHDVRLMLPDLADETRQRLIRFVDASGLERRVTTVARARPPEDVVASIARSTDVAWLGELASGDDAALVHEAAIRLLLLGAPGTRVVVELLERTPPVPHFRPLAESIPLWDDDDALARARELADDPRRPRVLRFRVIRALVERGEKVFVARALELLRDETTERFFEASDYEALVHAEGDADRVAVALAESPHPHAYLRAVGHLVASGSGADTHDALRAFLERGRGRMGSLRRSAALHLHLRGDPAGFPLVLEHDVDATTGTSTLLRGVPPRLVELTTTAYLAAGSAIAKEPTLLHHLSAPGVDPVAAEDATATILMDATSDAVRTKAAARLRSGFGVLRFRKLHRVADTFAWGVRTGRELLGKNFGVQMTGGALGHTRLNERVIHVTALPILRGDQHGREIVEGLILHEFGHHMYHKGTEEERVWTEAQRAGLHDVLNLVADEHLERRLRAMDAEYGDRLKRLAAYAFQHASREIEVERLVSHTGGHTFEVLSQIRLGVAKDPKSVAIDSGDLLARMEQSGLSFSRFVRALRMGLGNRHDDPRVERALELFRGGSFRGSTMKQLYDVTLKLKEIFGWETQLVQSFGPHESLEPGSSDEVIWGEGITQEDVDREVQRVLDPKSDGRDPGRAATPGRPWINIAPKADFDRIGRIETLPFDGAEHARLASRVRRPAAIMRRFLEDLGMRLVPQRMRLSGIRIDKTRLKPLVLRGDPRALVARSRETRTDLFLGIVVDCSGSMSARDNMERARLFAALLGESARGLSGVDFRAFGFTDKVIYDAGDANRCAAHALHAGGGNNDAAALFHVANVAKASRRKAKLLVMISDGLPTECSVAALRELVQTLGSRERMVCAQAAVQPLAEVCFPNYVVLNDPSIELTVSKFGKVVARLVQRALTV